MEQEGIPVKLVREWYQGVNGVLLSSIKTKVGVRQRDKLSPLLFNMFINGIVQQVKEDGEEMGDLRIPVLLFADDMVLLVDEDEELERMVGKFKEYCEEWRLEVNVSKTKVMVISKNGDKVVW
jgi:retron-type reverse transcriptase